MEMERRPGASPPRVRTGRRFRAASLWLLTLLNLLALATLVWGAWWVWPSLTPTPVQDTADRGSAPAPPATTGATLVPSPTATIDVAARLVARTNQYRQQFGCPALVLDERLTRAAQRHAEDMARNDQYGHTGSDGSSPSARMTAAGYRWSVAAENVAAGFTTPEAVVDAWFNETPPNDGHRRNILNCALRNVGIGYYYLPDDGGAFTYQTYWTQDLAAP